MRHFVFISMLFLLVCSPSFGSCALSIIFEKMHNVSTLPNDFEEVIGKLIPIYQRFQIYLRFAVENHLPADQIQKAKKEVTYQQELIATYAVSLLHLKAVASKVEELRSLGVTDEEIVSVYSLGIIRAMNHWDPEKSTFSSYATRRLIFAFDEEITIFQGITRREGELISKIKKTQLRLIQELGRFPTETEWFHATGLSYQVFSSTRSLMERIETQDHQSDVIDQRTEEPIIPLLKGTSYFDAAVSKLPGRIAPGKGAAASSKNRTPWKRIQEASP